tara:strand:+ start:7886 stop:8830 length:945 start_codon:yes stop_codon:yes gene_type:complete
MNVSVIVSVYNAADILKKTLPPLLNQDYPTASHEIILVNDSSTDNTIKLITSENWKDRLTILNHDENRGRSATRNTGLRQATGDIVIFIDCDIEVPLDFISKHVEYHNNEKIIGLLSNLQSGTPAIDKYHRYLFSSKRGAKRCATMEPLPYRYFILTATSIKRLAINKTGEFNHNLKGYGIDLHYSYRLWNNFSNNLFFASDIIVKQYKLKTFFTTLSDLKDYGANNLPKVLSEFPELAKDTGADYISGCNPKVLLGKILFNKIIRRIVEIMYYILPTPLCNPFIRYRMVDALTGSYRDFLKRKKLIDNNKNPK